MPKRMRSVMSCAVAGLCLAVAAKAEAEDCASGTSDKLVLLDWSAQPGRLGPEIAFRMKSNLPKAVRSLVATLVFEDSQGNWLADMPLSPGLKLEAGAESSVHDTILGASLDTTLVDGSAKARICTRYVEYVDGDFEEF